jgi:ribosomal protein L11 methyltransferase
VNEYYFELKITPSAQLEDFESFVMDESGEAIETDEETIIVRSEEDPSFIIEEVTNYALELSEIFGEKITVKCSISKQKNEDWITKFKEGFEPIQVGRFFIRASWHEEKDGSTNIVVDPALAFGTGHHPTTKNSILAIEKYAKPNDKMLDVGCGSGILSLCAIKCGAVVDMCDTDELAIKSATENFEKNGEKFNKSWVGTVSNEGEYDIIVANIIADVLVFLAKDIKRALKKGGITVLSGILDKYESKVADMYDELELVEKIIEDEWLTMVYKK